MTFLKQMFIGLGFRHLISRSSLRLPRSLFVVFTVLLLVLAAIAQRPPVAATPRAERAAPSWLADAESLLASGRIREAKQKTEEELRAHPSSMDGYNLLGIICSQEKDYACAEGAFDRALKLDPASAETHNNLGNLLVTEGKPELAEKEFPPPYFS